MLLTRTPLSLLVLMGMALAVGFAITAMVASSDVLPGDIAAALTTSESSREPGNMISVHRPPTAVARGMQLGFLVLLLGGIPAAILASVLAAERSHRETEWAGGWANVFRAGFVFQLTSLLFTMFLLLLLLWAGFDSRADARGILLLAGPLLLSSGCGMWGLRSWRSLEFRVTEMQTSITKPPPDMSVQPRR